MVNVLNRTSMDIDLFNTNFIDEIQMSVLLTRSKNLGWIGSIFRYLNSLLVKDTHDRIFRKNTSYIPSDNGSSFNIPITIKIIALSNITVIETSVLALYLSLHYLFFNLPLLCTSSWRFEICLPPIYNPVEFSPNDQIQPKLFVSINRLDICIPSDKVVLNKPISMEVQFNTFPFLWWCE